MKSVWLQENIPQYKTLDGDITADVLIIGGGIAGILCASALSEEGVDYVLLEKGRILNGNTGNTTAKITVGHGLVYQKILKKYGKDTAKKYYIANKRAIERYKLLSKQHPCDFETKDMYVYSKTDYKKIHKEFEALRVLGVEAEVCEAAELPFVTKGAIKYKNQAQFNPLKFLSSVAKDLNIYENSFVRKVKGNTAFTDSGTVTFKKVIFATHFPFIDRFGLFFFKMHQHRSYVLALKNALPLSGMYVDECDKGLSLRSYGKYLLLAGGGGKTGKKNGGFDELIRLASLYYPKAEIAFKFAAQDCMTVDNLPYIGRYTYFKDNYFVATGFNTWGMTNAYVAAEILCDMVTGKQNDLAQIFNPQRCIFTLQLLCNACNAVINLLTPTAPRCSHMGCALKWNRQEKVWECPCHGSRFSKDGEILDNPTTKEKKF